MDYLARPFLLSAPDFDHLAAHFCYWAADLDYLARSFSSLGSSFGLFCYLLPISIIWPGHFCYLLRSFRLLSPQFRITWVGHFGNSQLTEIVSARNEAEDLQDEGARLNEWKKSEPRTNSGAKVNILTLSFQFR
jgi:hypothetical protein